MGVTADALLAEIASAVPPGGTAADVGGPADRGAASREGKGREAGRDMADILDGLVVPAAEQAAFERDWRGIVQNPAELVLLPRSTAEVARIVTACARLGIGIVPQGGNTGLVAGAVPVAGRPQVIVNLSRMRAIRAVDPVDNTMVVEAGVVLAAAQEAAEKVDRLFPLSLAAEGSCQIGGNIATNAGGLQVLSYGTMRNLVLGLEVVLPDGRVWDGLRSLRKDNTGFDLKQLFIGSEGTLGIITAATLRLLPRARSVLTVFAGVPSPEAAMALFIAVREAAGSDLTSFEYFGQLGLSLVRAHGGQGRSPFSEDYPAYTLFEISSPDPRRDLLPGYEPILTEAYETGRVLDVTVAQSEAQRKALWALRDDLSEGERAAGGAIKHDVAVPVARTPEVVEAIEREVSGRYPEARLNIFGHLGDGNLHVNVLPPVGTSLAAFDPDRAVTGIIERIVVERGGTFSAEHGIGQLRRASLLRYRSAVELSLMRTIKRSIDPAGIMNPGKVLEDTAP